MRKVEYVLHDFAELSEAAKKVAIDEVREAMAWLNKINAKK